MPAPLVAGGRRKGRGRLLKRQASRGSGERRVNDHSYTTRCGAGMHSWAAFSQHDLHEMTRMRRRRRRRAPWTHTHPLTRKGAHLQDSLLLLLLLLLLYEIPSHSDDHQWSELEAWSTRKDQIQLKRTNHITGSNLVTFLLMPGMSG